MLHLFLDDSGKESQHANPWVCMAGYLADNQTLLELYGKWFQLLTRHQITEIHMKHIIPIEGQYKKLGWDIPKRDSVAKEFIQVINETRMFGLDIGVEVSAWRAMKRNHPELNFGSIQQFCLERILRRTMDHLQNADINDTLALVFDTDPEFGTARFNLFCGVIGHDPRGLRTLSSITFGHPISYPGLQCADLLVWETRKELMQKRDGYQSTKRWQQMFTRIPSYHLEYVVGERWDDETFKNALPNILAIHAR